MKFNSHYAQLGQQFSRKSLPEKPENSELLLWNEQLAQSLDLNLTKAEKTAIFSGQQIATGSEPIATAYSGHQFGHFNPQLGDGRAHLLGELTDHTGQIQDIQLKGSGQTPFSRNGDGKCGIKPAVREYLMSETMHAMGVPTTRCLAVVTTGETIHRQTQTPGAVVTRVASSHIRVGTFEYFAARQMSAEIKKLADLTIKRHYPDIGTSENSKYIRLLSYVIDNQIHLITEWMRVGFIHGVMNTDNTLLSGDTIDYGPCAMLGMYDPSTVFSSIDRNGRYAFANQAKIAQWNMARLSECLLPLIHEDEQQAIDSVMPLLESFPEKYNLSFNQMMAKKLGFNNVNTEVTALHNDLLELMFKHQLDYTKTFVQLQNSLIHSQQTGTESEDLHTALQEWQQTWLKQLEQENIKPDTAFQLMTQNNPVVIPRNHHMEQVLDEVESNLSIDSVQEFLAVIQSPYAITTNSHKYQDPSPDGDLNYQTFCGT